MSSVTIQILSVESVDSSPSVVIATENNRYIFDIGEGTQRLCVEHKTRLGKVHGLFITRLNHEVLGGLPGWTLIFDACC